MNKYSPIGNEVSNLMVLKNWQTNKEEGKGFRKIFSKRINSPGVHPVDSILYVISILTSLLCYKKGDLFRNLQMYGQVVR